MEACVIDFVGGRERMEDASFLVDKHQDNGTILGGIFDGHRLVESAQNISFFATEIMQLLFKPLLDESLTPAQVFNVSYRIISELSHSNLAGTTALCFYVHDNKMVVANTGDSRLVLFPRNSNIITITNDHNFHNDAEFRRVKNCGGTITEDYRFQKLGIEVAISRAIGDLHFADVGLIPNPEIFELDIQTTGDNFYIFATDGFWNELSYQTICKVINKSATAQEACENLKKEILNNLEEDELDQVDNVTILVIKT